MRRVLLVLFPLALVLLAGCPSLSTLQTPATVPKNQLRFGVGLEAVGFNDGGETFTAPQTEFNARYGVTDDVDIGAKLYFLGVEIGAKYQFLRGQFDAAVAPALSYISFSASSSSGDSEASSSISIAYIHLPLLFGYNVNDRLTLGFGPKLLYILASGDSSASSGGDTSSSSATADGIMAGGYVQLAYRVGDAFWVAPELNIYKPFQEGTEGVFFQGGLGLLFGGAPSKQPMGQPMGQPMAPAMGAPPQ